MGLLSFLSKGKAWTIRMAIIGEFYSDYPETPYISDDRKVDWITQARTFPKTTPVQKNMMIRFSDGLLPGHVYMLHWLKEIHRQKIPSYFEYKYGMDFVKEKAFLRNNGYLDDLDKLTDKGKAAIQSHEIVIKNHAAKRDISIEGISKEIYKARDNMLKNGCKEYIFLANHDCCDVCAALNGTHFLISELQIGVNAPPMHEGCKCAIAPYVDRE